MKLKKIILPRIPLIPKFWKVPKIELPRVRIGFLFTRDR